MEYASLFRPRVHSSTVQILLSTFPSPDTHLPLRCYAPACLAVTKGPKCWRLHNQICTALPQARKNLWAVSGTCAVLFHLCGFSTRKNCGTVTVADYHNQICTALPQARKNLWAVSGTCAVLFHLCGFSIAEPRKNCGTVTVADYHNQICTALPQARKNLWAVSGTCAVLFHLCGFSIAEPRKNCGTVTVAD